MTEQTNLDAFQIEPHNIFLKEYAIYKKFIMFYYDKISGAENTKWLPNDEEKKAFNMLEEKFRQMTAPEIEELCNRIELQYENFCRENQMAEFASAPVKDKSLEISLKKSDFSEQPVRLNEDSNLIESGVVKEVVGISEQFQKASLSPDGYAVRAASSWSLIWSGSKGYSASNGSPAIIYPSDFPGVDFSRPTKISGTVRGTSFVNVELERNVLKTVYHVSESSENKTYYAGLKLQNDSLIFEGSVTNGIIWMSMPETDTSNSLRAKPILNTVFMTITEISQMNSTVSLVGITLTSLPTKRTYSAGEFFTADGMVVTANYSNGTSNVVTGYTYSPNGRLTASNTAITVSYTEGGVTKSVICAITVGPATITGISVVTAPTKTVYIEGDCFEPAGMTVRAFYTDSTSRDVTAYTWSPIGALNASCSAVNISYTENGVTENTTYPISVVASSVSLLSGRTQKELPFACSSGVGAVNTYSGRFCFNHKDVTVGAGSYLLGVAHNFNSHWEYDSRTKDIDNHMGWGWKLDIQQYVKASGNDLLYIDAAGNVNKFVYTSVKPVFSGVAEYTYFDELGSGTKIVIYKGATSIAGIYTMTDAAGNQITFDSDGRLSSTISAINPNIKKVITYDVLGRPEKMYDNRKPNRVIKFAYNSDALLSAIITEENGVEKHRVTCGYENGNYLSRIDETLRNVTESTNAVTRGLTSIDYDAHKCIKAVYNIIDKTGLVVETSNSLWTTSVKTGAVSDTNLPAQNFYVKASANFERTTNYLTSVTSDKNVKMNYELDGKGDCVSVYETVGSDDVVSSVLPSPEGKRFFPIAAGDSTNSTKQYTLTNAITPTSNNSKYHYEISEMTDDDKAAVTELLDENKDKYVMLSAWVYVAAQSLAAADELSVYLKLSDWLSSSETYYIPANKDKVGQWQYVSAVVKAVNFLFDFNRALSGIGISTLTGNSAFSVKISDFRVMAMPGGTHFKQNSKNIYELTSVEINGSISIPLVQTQTKPTDDFVTYEDIESTLLERYKNPSSFTFFYNNKRKFKGQVYSLKFISSGWSYTLNADATESSPIIYSETKIGSTEIKKHRVYSSEQFTDFIKYDGITDAATYKYDGRIVKKADEYGVTTDFNYDSNGNLISKIVGSGKTSDKLFQKFSYNGNDEMVSYTDDFGITHTLSVDSYSQPFSLAKDKTDSASGITVSVDYDAWLRKASVSETSAGVNKANSFTYDNMHRLNTVSDGNSIYSVGYDVFGNMSSLSEGENALLYRTHTYSSQYNKVATTYGNGAYANYVETYDVYGRLSKYGASAAATAWTYKDLNGGNGTSGARLTQIDDSFNGSTKTFSYDDNGNYTGYSVICGDAAGNRYDLNAYSTDSSRSTEYVCKINNESHKRKIIYDGKLINPRIVNIIDLTGIMHFALTYDNLGRIETTVRDLYGNVGATTQYDEYSYRSYTLPDGTFSSSVLSKVTRYIDTITEGEYIINYDAAGNVTGVNRSDTYGYDGKRQLISEKSGSVVTNYRYDNFGNRIQKKVGASEVNYSYQGNKLTEINDGNAIKHIRYDQCGNPVKYKTASETAADNMTWTRGSLLDSYKSDFTWKYKYDVDGVRTSKTKLNGSNVVSSSAMVTDGEKLTAEIRSDLGEIYYTYGIDGLCAISYKNEKYFVGTDFFGNVTEISYKTLDGKRQTVATYSYDAFGKCTTTAYAVHTPYETVSVSDPTHIAYVNPFRWKGYYLDSESQLYYVNGRYYDGDTGRFINPKSPEAVISDSSAVGGINAYILPCNNAVAFAPNSSTFFPSLQLVPSEKEDSAFWKIFNIIMAAITIVAGVIVSVCNAGAGIAMIAGGAISLCSQLISDRIGHIGRGIGSIIMGIASLAGGYTGICAVIMGILGVSSIALGVNEIATGITGENYMQTLTGMSEEMYGAIFAGVTIATALGNAFFAQCFAEGTLVKTEDGDKKIEDIEVGDKVLAYDEVTGKQEYKQVLRLFRNESSTKTTLQIIDEDGTVDEIISTPGHKYYLPDNTVNRNPNEVFEHASYECLGIKWVSACELKKGDRVLLSQNDTLTGKLKYGKVVNAKTEDCEEWTTYNLEVEDFHTYYVGENGTLVHNVNCGVGGKGWEGDATWKANVKKVGEGGTITELKGGIPTQAQAERLIAQSGGKLLRAEIHIPPNPHTFAHINYITSFQTRGTLQILEPFIKMIY